MKRIESLGRTRRLALAGVSALAISVGMLSGGAGLMGAFAGTDTSAAATSATVSQAPSVAPSVADVVARTKPGVVTVTTVLAPQEQAQAGPSPQEEFFRRFFGENGPFQGMPQMPGAPEGNGPREPRQGGVSLGSGFVISADGYVVTNYHVIDNAKSISVTLDDGTELGAQLFGGDRKNDIAVLKVSSGKPLTALQWGDSDKMRLGDQIIAIGDPFGIGTTVTSGIVSARGRDLNNGPYDDFLQIDAAINRGNSGGPLLNLDGTVIGINTAIYSPNGGSVGVGFAIPSAQAQRVVGKIMANGGGDIAYGYIGVMIQPVDEGVAQALGLARPEGAIVASVADGSPAARAGVQAGDVIVAVNGTTTGTPKLVSRAIADLAPGEKATLSLWRNGKPQDLSFAVGTLGDQMASADTGGQGAAPDTAGDVTVADVGLTVHALNPGDAQQAGLPEGTPGLVVTAVDGPAAEKGIEQGDVILSVNQQPVRSAGDLQKIVESVKGDRSAVLLLIQRNGRQSFVAVPFKTA
ncbi:MAG: Do family serine endopeptidase [Pseudomonadota bacterium]